MITLKKFKIYSLEMDRSFLQRSVPPYATRGQKTLPCLAPALLRPAPGSLGPPPQPLPQAIGRAGALDTGDP